MKRHAMQESNFLSKKDVSALLGLIDKTAGCTDEDDLHDLLCSMRTLIPYENALCMLGKRGAQGVRTFDAVKIMCAAQPCDLYALSKSIRIDTVRLKDSIRVFVHHHPNAIGMNRFQNDFLSMRYAPQGRDRHADRTRQQEVNQESVFAFTGQSVARQECSKMVLELFAPYLHQVLSRVFRQADSEIVKLTPKEKQVIKWLKEGKSNWETSAILGISERTVKFHISNIMQKLDASSRAHAVAIAIERGLVERDW
jgi:DNA-binding CsgD family transcriptional regulator